jgi:hypothetical protein
LGHLIQLSILPNLQHIETAFMAKNRDFSAEADAAFFASYDGIPVHEKMIKDEIRTKSYLNAMEGNPHLFKDKIVLDIGTGTGILSM